MSDPSRSHTPEPARGWELYEIARSDDPHGRWRVLREERPVLDTGSGVFFVSRWSLVNEILRDPRHGAGSGVEASFGEGEGLAFQVMRAWLMSLDGPPHVRARGLVRREFTPRRVASFEPMIETIVDERVRALEATATGEIVDLIATLAFPIPSQVIRSLFGLPEEIWRDRIEPIFRSGDAPADGGIGMIDSLSHFFDELTRGHSVPDGLLSALRLPDAELGELEPLEVVANAVLLATAAIDTTTGLIGNAIQCLLERPGLLARIRSEPDLLGAVIEETLRFEPPALSCSRLAGEPLHLEGVEIPAGSQLLLGLAAANRDPRRYDDPDRFSIERDQTGLLSFGGGRHFCLGAALARTEARIALERLLVRSELELEPTEAAVWDRRNPTVRALERLRVRIGRRSAR
ncbi:MAG: cytochrome P450 [Deltaproteobacteria bacterium]|nr:cytochrome P450 [Deltaproteobacteria bacterium]